MTFTLVEFPFNLMPHQEEIAEVLTELSTSEMTTQWWVNYLPCVPTFAVMKGSVFIGFITKDPKGDGCEIHLFIRKGYRKYSIPLMRQLRKEVRGDIHTSVYSTHYYLLPAFTKAGGTIVSETKGFASRDGINLDITFIIFKEAH